MTYYRQDRIHIIISTILPNLLSSQKPSYPWAPNLKHCIIVLNKASFSNIKAMITENQTRYYEHRHNFYYRHSIFTPCDWEGSINSKLLIIG